MIGGLPWTAWVLLAAAVAPGVGLAVVSYRVHRADHRPLDRCDGSGGVEGGGEPGGLSGGPAQPGGGPFQPGDP
jgi:hypothetical protein